MSHGRPIASPKSLCAGKEETAAHRHVRRDQVRLDPPVFADQLTQSIDYRSSRRWQNYAIQLKIQLPYKNDKLIFTQRLTAACLTDAAFGREII